MALKTRSSGTRQRSTGMPRHCVARRAGAACNALRVGQGDHIMAPASRGTGEKGLCPSVVAMQGGCDSSPCCGRVALSRRCPGLGMTVGPNRGGPFDQLATANLTIAGGQPGESVIFEPRPRGAVVVAFRQGCVCLVAGGGESENGTAEWRSGALKRSFPDASAIESNSERVDFAPKFRGATIAGCKIRGRWDPQVEPFRGRRESVRSLSALTAAKRRSLQPSPRQALGAQNIQTPISP